MTTIIKTGQVQPKDTMLMTTVRGVTWEVVAVEKSNNRLLPVRITWKLPNNRTVKLNYGHTAHFYKTN